MYKKIVLPLLICILVILGAFYFLTERQEEVVQEDTVEREEVSSIPEEIVEEEISEWEDFTNTDFSYTAQYPLDWEIDSDNLEGVWLYNQSEGIAILFASATATQTGFPEYELISQEESTVDGNPANTSLLYSGSTRAILTVFETEQYPHFVMMTYECIDGSQDEEMMNLNEEFLSRITFE